MSQKVLTSLAILKVEWDEGRDYIDEFVPFVAEAIRVCESSPISAPEVQSKIEDLFGLKIPRGALKTILGRAASKGYVKRKDGVYYRDTEALASLDIAAQKQTALRQHMALVDKFIEFCGEKWRAVLSEEQASEIILSEIAVDSIPILSAAYEGRPFIAPAKGAKRSGFMFYSFVQNMYDRDPEGFEYLLTLVKGSMLANVLFYEEIGAVSRKFEKVEFYFDTSFLLRALGFTESEMRLPCRELLTLLYELNASLRCFAHTVAEIRGILDVAEMALVSKTRVKLSHGEAFEHFIRLGLKPSDVEHQIAKLEDSLAALRIQVEPKPAHTPTLGVNEDLLKEDLLRDVGYRRDEPLQNDIDSLTAIYRLRNGEHPQTLEASRAVFVTDNDNLAKASAEFFIGQFGEKAGCVPCCIPDHILTTLVWLKKPNRAPSLPRNTILANCYAALNPSEHLWKKYLLEIENLQARGDVGDDDYILLRYSTEARHLLMNTTLGDPNAFTEGTALQILEKAKETVRAETTAELESERRLRENAELRAQQARSDLSSSAMITKERVREVSVSMGKATARACSLVAWIVLLLFATLLWPGLPLDKLGFIGNSLVFLAYAISSSLTVLGLVHGTNLRPFLREVEVRTADGVERMLLSYLGPKGS